MRGFSLVEMMVVVAILGVVSALALPDLTPVVRRTELRGALGDTVALVERARREARASGRCAKVERVAGGALRLSRANDVQCSTYTVLNTLRLPAHMTTLMESNSADITFLGNGRLAGDRDLDLEDDGARVTLTSTWLPGMSYYAGVTSSGLVCAYVVGALPPFAANETCFDEPFGGSAGTAASDVAAGLGTVTPPPPPPPTAGQIVNVQDVGPPPPPPPPPPAGGRGRNNGNPNARFNRTQNNFNANNRTGGSGFQNKANQQASGRSGSGAAA